MIKLKDDLSSLFLKKYGEDNDNDLNKSSIIEDADAGVDSTWRNKCLPNEGKNIV